MDPVSELVDSIKCLFDNPILSDLRIISRHRTYHAHKAIVCPRSDFFKNESGEEGSEVYKDGVLDLQGDDAQAVDSLVQYLYTLDYQSLAADEVVDPQAEAQLNRSLVSGEDIHKPEPEAASEVPASVDSLDDIPSMPTPTKKKNKKAKKRKPSQTAVQEGLTQDVQDAEHFPEAIRAETPPSEVSHMADSAIYVDGPGSEAEPPTPQPLEGPQKSIKLHARVYNLSTKYGIYGLQNLAMGKLASEAAQQWDTEEFLRAAREVYTPDPSHDNEALKEVIIKTLYEHPELLDKEETLGMMKGLDIMMDLFVYVRKSGNTFWR